MTLIEYREINKNNKTLTIKNIRKRAGKCGEYFTNKELRFIIRTFIKKSRKRLRVVDFIDYMRYQIIFTDWMKEIHADGRMEYSNKKYGNYHSFKKEIDSPITRYRKLYDKDSKVIIDNYDNNNYEYVLSSFEDENGNIIDNDYWRIIK